MQTIPATPPTRCGTRREDTRNTTGERASEHRVPDVDTRTVHQGTRRSGETHVSTAGRCTRVASPGLSPVRTVRNRTCTRRHENAVRRPCVRLSWGRSDQLSRVVSDVCAARLRCRASFRVDEPNAALTGCRREETERSVAPRQRAVYPAVPGLRRTSSPVAPSERPAGRPCLPRAFDHAATRQLNRETPPRRVESRGRRLRERNAISTVQVPPRLPSPLRAIDGR